MANYWMVNCIFPLANMPKWTNIYKLICLCWHVKWRWLVVTYILQTSKSQSWFSIRKCFCTRKNLVHSNHMVMIIDATSVQMNYFYIVRLVLCVILVINVCPHICDYYNHLHNCNVYITKWNHNCDYGLWLLHV
jgi:hypothetical protein